MPKTPSIPVIGIPAFEVTVNGSLPASSVSEDILSMEVEDTVDLPAMCHFTLNFWDQAQQKLKEVYLTKFKIGTSIAVKMGLAGLSPIFTGEVTALEPSYGGDGEGDSLTIRAYNRLHRLRFGTHQRTFEKMKDSEIASSIAGEVGLTGQVDNTAVKHAHVSQRNVNNLTFLLERAKPINYEVVVEDKTLFFRKSPEPEGPEITLTYRVNLLQFSPRQRTVSEGGKVEVRGWDVKNKKSILGKAGSGDETTKMGGSTTGAQLSESAFIKSTRTITDRSVIDADEANGMARAIYNRQQRDFVEADGTCPGIPDLVAGKTIEIEGVGDPFSGTYYVTSATHTLGEGGYETKFKVRRIAV
jgi:phage protein D